MRLLSSLAVMGAGGSVVRDGSICLIGPLNFQLVLLDVHVTLTATVVLHVRGHVWLPLVQVHVVHDSPEIVGAAKSMWLVSPHWYCGG